MDDSLRHAARSIAFSASLAVRRVLPNPELSVPARYLLVLNSKSAATGSPIFVGVGIKERARRRAAGKRQRAARRNAR